MGLFSKVDHHSGLMHRMADTVGADLSLALQHGKLSAPELRNAVMACMGCEETGACGQWLDDNGGAGATETPRYCRNHDLMDRLRG